MVVASDAVRAARVPITGATPVEEEAARKALTRLGEASPVVRVGFDDRAQGKGRRLVVQVRSPKTPGNRQVRNFEADWLGQLVVLDVVTTLRKRNVRIDWAELRGAESVGTTTTPASGARRTPAELRRLAERIVERGVNAGLDVREVTAYPIATGAVRVVVRLTQRQILENTNTRWSRTLLPDRFQVKRPYSAMLVVLAPDGTPVHYGGNYSPSAGGTAYGVSSALPPGTRSSPALPEGPTRLEITIERAIGQPSRLTFLLDCESESIGVLDPDTACERLEREWVAFLPPVAGDTTCIGGFTDQMSLKGTIGGVPVSRDYSNCYMSTTNRWEELLGVEAPS
ncbi:MAG: hypothetical protein ACRDON_03430 [Gaiellaceae bacterium]